MNKKGAEFDFYQAGVSRKKEQYEAYCGECRRKYITGDDDIADREICPTCFKWFNSAKGRAENKKRLARMKEKFGDLQEIFTPPEDEESEYVGEF